MFNMNLGTLYQLRLRQDHFTHAFIDEAGQATEPLTLVPLGLVNGISGQIVLCGDPLQLGPVLQSEVAGHYGLQTSFLERLTLRRIYKRDEVKFIDHGCYDPVVMTKLVNNYRAHKDLLTIYSDAFYFGELVPCASLNDDLKKLTFLPNQSFPLLFHGINGENLKENSSPSWYNPAEVFQCTRYLKLIYEASFTPNDVGIITPYKKQVEKIRFMIDTMNLPKTKVGSVEEFQGQERKIIIVSTVRSVEGLVGFDIKHHIGFLSNPKRYNVSVSRAQSLLIVIGNPMLLSRDPHWGSLLRYAIKNKVYVGTEFALPE